MQKTTGEKLLQIARAHVGERYVFGVRVPKNNPNWKGPWDCAEFVSWLVFQAGAGLYGCHKDQGDPANADAFTGYWARDGRNLGQIISLEQAARTPGAAMLRLPKPSTTGHLVLSDGRGGTVEAHSPADGVIESTLSNRRWDAGILVPGIAYSQGPSVPVEPPDTVIYRLKLPLMTGPEVTNIQEALAAKGFDPGVIDGEFGPHTHAAVVAFQLSTGMVPDGEVGPQTAAGLDVQL
jgi:hypothetical protein